MELDISFSSLFFRIVFEISHVSSFGAVTFHNNVPWLGLLMDIFSVKCSKLHEDILFSSDFFFINQYSQRKKETIYTILGSLEQWCTYSI